MKKVIIKKHFNAKLNEVEKLSQEWSQQLRATLEHAENSPNISNSKAGFPKTLISKLIEDSHKAFISSLPDSLAFQENAHEKIHSDIQAWTAEAHELFQAATNTTFLNITQLAEHIRSNPPSAGAIAILVIEAAERERERALEEKNKRFTPVRKKGTQKIIENARQLHDRIVKINADLLTRPANEGWGSKKKRADYIAKNTGKSYSYISKIIAVPRKINQT